MTPLLSLVSADEADSGIGLCGWLLTMISWGIVAVTLPFSLFVCFKVMTRPASAWDRTKCLLPLFQVVQEYERSVIFRLGRLRKGGAKGPGIFFIIPCIDTYRKVDLRTVSFDVPPQEVSGEIANMLERLYKYTMKQPFYRNLKLQQLFLCTSRQ